MLRCICVEDLSIRNCELEKWPEFSFLQCNDLLMNVYQHCVWGSYRHVLRGNDFLCSQD